MIEKIEKFFNRTEYYSDLTLLYIFYEHDGVPLLFVCIDDFGSLYLCFCIQPYGIHEWTLSKTNRITLKNLVKKNVTIANAMKIFESGYILNECEDGSVSAEYVEELTENNLPPLDMYLDYVCVSNDDFEYLYREQLSVALSLLAEESSSHNKSDDYTKKLSVNIQKSVSPMYKSIFESFGPFVETVSKKLGTYSMNLQIESSKSFDKIEIVQVKSEKNNENMSVVQIGSAQAA